MDLDNPVIQLCIAGTRAEYEGRVGDARELYSQAWQAARNDFEACVAAHYVARHQDDPQAALHWNQVALARAEAVGDERVWDFYPSLYVNLGRAHENLGNLAEARRYYQLAADLGLVHQDE
jgi:tetratricopeptide (TPR) repeat protein